MEVSKTAIKQGTDPLSMIGKSKKKIHKISTNADNKDSSIDYTEKSKKLFGKEIPFAHKNETSSNLQVDKTISNISNGTNNINSTNANALDTYFQNNIDKSENMSEKEILAKNINLPSKHFASSNNLKSNINNEVFFPEEAILECVKAYVFKEQKEYIGKLYLTEYQIVFQFSDFYKYKNTELIKQINDTFSAYYFSISKVEKIGDKTTYTDKYSINIFFNSGLQWRIIILTRDYKFYLELLNKVYPKDYNSYYTFSRIFNKTQREKAKQNSISLLPYCEFNGWTLYSREKEFLRQGIQYTNKFRVTKANKNFNICKTYPEFLVVSSEISDDTLSECAQFRSKGRLPSMTYFNYRKSKGSLWRCSQPKTGITNNRNKSDEKVLINIKQNSGLVIFDARPYLSAMGNRVKGGGTEITENYDNTKLIFCDIDNIHSVSESYIKLFQLNKSDDNLKYYSQLENTHWFEFTSKIFKYSKEIAKLFLNNFSVLVHCSDGWDRSAQLLAIAQIIIDPYYRTGFGFATLIEKDFVSFGHQFGLRSGIKVNNQDEEQKSPVFIQFLDCIYQLIYQFPDAFEFNEVFLLFLAKHFHSLLYGTFLFNCEMHRKDNKANQITRSIWSDVFLSVNAEDDILKSPTINSVVLMSEFSNENYNPIKYSNDSSTLYNKQVDKELIFPEYGVKNLVIWENYFNVESNILNKVLCGDIFSELIKEPNKENKHIKNSNNSQNSNKISNDSIIKSFDSSSFYISKTCFNICSSINNNIIESNINISSKNSNEINSEIINELKDNENYGEKVNEVEPVSSEILDSSNNNIIVDIENKIENKDDNENNSFHSKEEVNNIIEENPANLNKEEEIE